MTEMGVADQSKVVHTVANTNVSGVATATAFLDISDTNITDDVTTLTINHTNVVVDVEEGTSARVSLRISPSKLPRLLNYTSASLEVLKPRLIEERRVDATSATTTTAGEPYSEEVTREEASLGATSLTLFPNLPAELRLKVWRIACAPSQELHITIDCDGLSSTTDYGNGDGVYDIGIYRANRESRREALLFNGPVFTLPTRDCFRLMLDTVYFNNSHPRDCPKWPGGERRSHLFQLLSMNLSLTVQIRSEPVPYPNSHSTICNCSQFKYKNLVFAPAESREHAELMVKSLDKIFVDEKHLDQMKEQWLDILWVCHKRNTRKMMICTEVKIKDDREFKEARAA